MIATPTHRKAILRHLEIGGIHIDKLRHYGDLLMLDARDTLSSFMIRGQIDDACFRETISLIIEQVRRGREQTVVRTYSEMADVLWKDGKSQAAIRLEVLWNDLARAHPFSLLSGYAMGNFYKKTEALSH